MLSGWRVLDLTDDRGDVGPFLLADLGADVLKVEPPGGCPSRRAAPAGAHFAAYNANKRSIELTGDDGDDRAAVLDLVAASDLIFDSGPPGRLARLGIGDRDVTGANPRAVSVLVTPFGADGPRADQPASELTIAALGGLVRLQGTPSRAPVQISVPQVWRHAGAEAAVAALVAHRRMEATGQAQFVDVSAQAAMTWTMLNAMEAHEIHGRDFERTGSEIRLNLPVELRLEAADGHVLGVPTARSVEPLLPWLIEDGIVPGSWAEVDWASYDRRVILGQPVELQLNDVIASVLELCRRHTRNELFERGLAYGASLAPLNTLADLLAFEHLVARDFWVEVAPGEPASTSTRHAGAFWRRDGQRPPVTRGWQPTGQGAPSPPARAHRPGAGPSSTGAGPNDPAGPSSTGAGPNDPAKPAGPPGLPLAGLKVVDLSWIGVGPITAKALADHGAEVVRVESRQRIDRLRQQLPFKDGQPGLNRSHFYGTFNTSKLGITVDLKSRDGLDVARRLAGWADVLIESFTPGTIERLGLGYGACAAANPSLIMVSTSLLGPGSPVSSLAGYGYHAAAIAGFQGLVGWPDLPPDGPWLAYTDTIAPRFITAAVLAAVRQRRLTGEGCHLDVAQLEASLQLLAPELLAFQLTGELPARRGNRSPDLAPQGVYPCRGDDQWLAISVVDDERWEQLVDLAGRPGWARDPGLGSLAGRQANHDLLDAGLAGWTSYRDAADLEEQLAGRGIAAGVVQGSRQLSQDPQYQHRRFYRYLEHGEVGVVPYAGHQYRIRGYDHGPRWAAPCLGEHTRHVLSKLLGLDPPEIAELEAGGALR